MSWKTVQISSFLTERKGRFKPDEANQKQLKRIEKIDFTGNIHLAENKPTKTSMILVKKGDLVISGINAEKGAISIYQEKEDVMATIHYSSYTFDSNQININYFKWFLKSKTFLKILKDQTRGGIKTELKPKRLLPLQIDLPDLKTQEAILFKIEFIEKEYETLLNELSGTISYCKKLKQSILQEAIQGKLTREWREENSELITGKNSAEALLENIKAKKARLIKEKKLKAGKTINHPVSLIDDIHLPRNWSWCKSDSILFTTKLAGFEYTKHISLQESGEIPVIRAQNVRPFKIDKTNLLYIDEETSLKLERCALTKKSLLVTFIGAGIGDVATFDEEIRWHLAPNVAKMEPFDGCEGYINIDYLNIFLSSPIGRKEIFKHIKATAQPSLSMGTIRDIDFPIPPIEEQKAIVAKVEALMEKCTALEQQITQSEVHTQMLMQAVLKEAFEEEKDEMSLGMVAETNEKY